MGDIEFVVNHSKKIENILETLFKAEGRGLHEKLSFIESKIPEDLCKKIRFVATIRNKIVHEDGYKKLEDKNDFNQICNEIINKLENTIKLNEKAEKTNKATNSKNANNSKAIINKSTSKNKLKTNKALNKDDVKEFLNFIFWVILIIIGIIFGVNIQNPLIILSSIFLGIPIGVACHQSIGSRKRRRSKGNYD